MAHIITKDTIDTQIITITTITTITTEDTTDIRMITIMGAMDIGGHTGIILCGIIGTQITSMTTLIITQNMSQNMTLPSIQRPHPHPHQTPLK